MIIIIFTIHIIILIHIISPKALLPANLDHLADPPVGHWRCLHPTPGLDPGNEGQFIFWYFDISGILVIHVASFITRSIPSHDVEKSPTF